MSIEIEEVDYDEVGVGDVIWRTIGWELLEDVERLDDHTRLLRWQRIDKNGSLPRYELDTWGQRRGEVFGMKLLRRTR